MPSLRPLLSSLLLLAAAGSSQASRPGTYNHTPKTTTPTHNAGSSQYASTIWAGAFIDQNPVTSITGTFTIPTISPPTNATDATTTSYCGGAWIGIDGVTNICVDGGLMQAGVNWCILNGATTYTPWSEYWPEEAQVNFENFTVGAGDQIRVSINTTSTTSGTATLENLSASGAPQVVRTWTDVSPALCFDTAEWVVEDFEVGDAQVPFADFGSVIWTDTAALVDGVSVGASQGLTLQLQSASTGAVMAEGSLEGDDVVIDYV